MVVEYGELKRMVRWFIDARMDHGAALNSSDPLVAALAGERCKVLELPTDPTVEALAAFLHATFTAELDGLVNGARCRVDRVIVQETHVNAAEVRWTP